jgi:hypothetical protein
MKFSKKLAEYLFPYDNGNIGLPLLAIATATLSSGVVAICLWIVHSPPTPSASDAVQLDCLEGWEKICDGQTR